MEIKIEHICYYCKHSTACGWHQWYCNFKDEAVSEQNTCDDFEEE
jgi:hypothetical protein